MFSTDITITARTGQSPGLLNSSEDKLGLVCEHNSNLQVTDIFAKWKKTQNCNLVQPEPIKMSKNHKIGAKSKF